MKTAAEYRAMAEECFKWAREAKAEEVRAPAALAVQDCVVCHVGKGQCYELINEVGITRAQVVGKIRGDRLLAGTSLNLVGNEKVGGAISRVYWCRLFARAE